MHRIYLNQPLETGAALRLTDEKFNYLARALRVRIDETITLFNGAGGEYRAVITEINRRDLSLLIGDFIAIERSSSLNIHLYQSMAKGDKLELVFQKATELGVTTITPLITERAVVNLNENQLRKRMERWNTIIQSACEQSGLNRIPLLNKPLSIEDLLQKPFTIPHLTLAPTANQSLSKVIQNRVIQNHLTQQNDIALIIGPEGGLTKHEISELEKQGAHSALLGERILRTETAALAVISTLHALVGDWH